MVTVNKCCLCLRLSTGGIILGSYGAFTSLLLVIVVGGFLLSYDNFVAQAYQKGSNGSEDNKKLAVFLEKYKNGENEQSELKGLMSSDSCSCRYNHADLCCPSSHQLCQFTFISLWNSQCKNFFV